MLVTFATNKLEITICPSILRDINFEIKILWQRLRLPGLPRRPDKPCQIPVSEHSTKGSPMGEGRQGLLQNRNGAHLLAVK